MKKNRKEKFLEQSKEVHGNRYDYSKVVYVDDETLVKIGCPEHGEFEQTPHKHLIGERCEKCLTLLSFEESKSYINQFGFQSETEYLKWWDENLPLLLPRRPDIYYKHHS